ncbi:MAG: ABC transporter permease [Lachnospiraceae bacterium]
MNNTGKTIKRAIGKLGPLLALILLMIALAIITEGRFVTISNLMNILRQTPIIALMAVGMLCVILLGGIDLSAGSLLAISICTAGVFMQNFGINNAFVLIVVCLVVGILAGSINGLLLTKLHLPHPFIATLGMKNICRGLALLITGATAISGFPKGVTFVGTTNIGGRIPISFILTLVMYVIMHIFLTRTGLGRKIYSFGGNQEAARLAGINTDRVQVFCYAASGFFCAMAGIVYMGRLNSAVPLASLEGDLDAIASCIIGGASFLGGKGNVWGTFIGAIMIAVIRNGCDLIGVSSDLQQIVIGAVIIVAVFVDVVRTQVEAKSKRLAVAKLVEE